MQTWYPLPLTQLNLNVFGMILCQVSLEGLSSNVLYCIWLVYVFVCMSGINLIDHRDSFHGYPNRETRFDQSTTHVLVHIFGLFLFPSQKVNTCSCCVSDWHGIAQGLDPFTVSPMYMLKVSLPTALNWGHNRGNTYEYADCLLPMTCVNCSQWYSVASDVVKLWTSLLRLCGVSQDSIRKCWSLQNCILMF